MPASSSSSSSSTKSEAVRQKLAALSRIRQISSCGRSRGQSALFHSQSAGLRPKRAISQTIFGVRRRSSDQTPDVEPDTKLQRLSDAGERFNSESTEKPNCLATESSVRKLDNNESPQLESNRSETHPTANALSLVSNYNSSSSSSNDSHSLG